MCADKLDEIASESGDALPDGPVYRPRIMSLPVTDSEKIKTPSLDRKIADRLKDWGDHFDGSSGVSCYIVL